MVDYKLITGTLIQSYNICPRQTWLMAHQIIPDQECQYIELGRLIDEESYARSRKKIKFENIVIDLIISKDGNLVVGEVKKSSRAVKGAKMQLAYYLYRLKQNGVMAQGQLLFPKERKRIIVELSDELVGELEVLFAKINGLILRESPPRVKRIKYCRKCGYKEFCLS